jgi:hypothetical protein
MSFLNTFRAKQEVAQNAHEGHPAGNNLNMTELYRLRQMERNLQQTMEELEDVKGRLSRIEKSLAERGELAEGSGLGPTSPPLPITELKQLSEMAKRFK